MAKAKKDCPGMLTHRLLRVGANTTTTPAMEDIKPISSENKKTGLDTTVAKQRCGL
jgi:hypothetical protein